MVMMNIFIVTSTAFPQNNAIIKVNKFWGAVNEAGAGVSAGAIVINGPYFADYNVYAERASGNESFFGGYITLATTNWTDPSSNLIAKAVLPPVNKLMSTGDVVKPLENYTRYSNINYQIYNADNSTYIGQPEIDFGYNHAVDASKCIGTSDQTVTVTNEYACGVQVERKVLAWSQQDHDNYAILDLTFTNTSSNTLTDFYIFMQGADTYETRSDGSNPSVAAVDQYANNNSPRSWFHYYGARTSDTLRIFYMYDSDDPENAGSVLDRYGQPLTQQGGRLLDKDFFFMSVLHASQQPYTPTSSYSGPVDPNDVDDMNQPSVTTFAYLTGINLPVMTSSFNPNNPDYYNFISGQTLASEDTVGPNIRPGHHRKNLDELGMVAPGEKTLPGLGPLVNTFESMVFSYGPYTFAPGQQIRIVIASGYAGISREAAAEIGRKWLADRNNGTSTLQDPPGIPNPTTGYFPDNFVFPPEAQEYDLRKDRWYSTGIDSIHLTVSRAKYNFLTNYNVPVTPPPPSSVSIIGTGEGIELEWAASDAESSPNFQGYRVWRKVSDTDTTFYQLVTSTDPSDRAATHHFADGNIAFGAEYYYYVQAGIKIDENDMSAHPSERGKTIWSSRIWFVNTRNVQGERQPGSKLDDIVIAPNPFNANDPIVKEYGWTNPDNLRVLFFNLPITITIRIFTESGDLVKTINHDKPLVKAGSNEWNLSNEYGQTVASGIYIVVFETPDGAVSYQKLIVVR
jgi:hypothetical protein